MKVAVIIPSRGLMFSQTAEEVLTCLKDVPKQYYFSHRKPIPDCFEDPTLKALEDPEITHILYIEDDMVVPPDTFWEMFNVQEDVVTCDYPVTKEGKGAVFKDPDGNIVFTGTGCLLIRREVFDKLEKPYFRSDIRWTPLNYGKTIKLQGSMHNGEGYGLHDVTFGIKLWKAGIKIHEAGKLGQRKLISLGKTGTNDGAHKIENWSKIKKDYQLKKLFSMPLATAARGTLVTVNTPSGGINTTKKHAANLIKQGLATPINEKKVIIDDSEVKW